MIGHREADHEGQDPRQLVGVTQPARHAPGHVHLAVQAQGAQNLEAREGQRHRGEPGLEADGAGEEQREELAAGGIVQPPVDAQPHRHRCARQHGADDHGGAARRHARYSSRSVGLVVKGPNWNAGRYGAGSTVQPRARI